MSQMQPCGARCGQGIGVSLVVQRRFDCLGHVLQVLTVAQSAHKLVNTRLLRQNYIPGIAKQGFDSVVGSSSCRRQFTLCQTITFISCRNFSNQRSKKFKIRLLWSVWLYWYRKITEPRQVMLLAA
jgi:hypothetical protein